MPKIISNILVYASLSLVLVGIAVGSWYLYADTNSKKQDFNAVVQSFDAKKKAQAEIDKLALMKQTYTAQTELNSIGVNAYTSVSHALSDIDATGVRTDPLRRKIDALMAQWQDTINSIHDPSAPSVALMSQADSGLALMQAYIAELQQQAPSGSQQSQSAGQQQTGAYTSAIDSAQTLVAAAQSDLTNAASAAGATSSPSGGTTIPPITPSDIQTQQQIVNQTSQSSQTTQTSQTSQSQSAQQTQQTQTQQTQTQTQTQQTQTQNPVSGNNVPPPAPSSYSASGTPQLIEGSNSY